MKTTLLTPNLFNHLGKMKALLFVLLLSFVLLGCKEDDVDPDLTKEFVGTWSGVVVVENGYETKTDWVIVRTSDNSVKITSTYNFIAKDPKYTSRSTVTNIENVTLSRTIANSISLNTTEEIAIPGDTIIVKGVGIVQGKTLTFSSTGTSKKTGQVTTPPASVFNKM
ncbi:hypothetical protein [Dyadobacter sp. CY347]|uniref:hypothetical protein n=1 Tax=Dyadobacter sp. CY347 TaxID=2909336 RepID=UPI001F1D03A1|nr:hypothetical protein [Dyadobacter sp. CY347]MCF2491176.1 hypothetical protein [Dyadobacter sp. CY347]